MLHILLIILGTILVVCFVLWLVISALLIVGYFLFCGPYLWWSSAYLPKDRRKFSMIRDYRNAFRYYKSKFSGKPPVFL